MNRLSRFFGARPHLIPCLVAAGMLFAAIADRPYAYYQLLRVVVTASALVVTWVAAERKAIWAVWVFAVTALLFNPIEPVQVGRAAWRWIDPAVGVLFLLGATTVTRK